MNILMSLMMLSMIFVMLTMSEASGERVAEVLNEKSTLKNPEHPVYKVENGSIEFRDVSFSYSATAEKPVLEHINLSIRSGETIGIIGGTGSSKSSLVNLVSRLYDVSEGAVLVAGRDVRDYDMELCGTRWRWCFRKMCCFPAPSWKISDGAMKTPAWRSACRPAAGLRRRLIQQFPDKYDTYIEQGGTNVSGGQKQRLCIARASPEKAQNPDSGRLYQRVDTATDARIRKAFADEIPDTTKLIIAQRISSVQNADRIIVMENGRVNGFGTHDELLQTNEIYRDVYESQIGGSGDFDENGGEA